jgi:hypothetical protein
LPNTDGLINCLRQPGQLRYQLPKSMVLNSYQLIKSSGTETHPAAETQSNGLPAYAQLAQVFAESLRKFCLDQKAFVHQLGFVHLPGLSHLEVLP